MLYSANELTDSALKASIRSMMMHASTLAHTERFAPAMGIPLAKVECQLSTAFEGATLTDRSCGVTSLGSIEHDMMQLHTLQVDSLDAQTEVTAMRSLINRGQLSVQIHVIIMHQGEIEVQGRQCSRTIGPGAITALFNWEPFILKADEPTTFTVLTMSATWGMPEVLGDSAVAPQQLIPAGFVGSDEIRSLALKLSQGETAPADIELGIRLLAFLLKGGFEYYAKDEADLPPNLGRIGRLMRVIALNMTDEHYSPAIAARDLRCSVRTIHKTCAQHGTSFNQLQLGFRLKSASLDLVYSSDRISEIAFQNGFVSLSHFCRTFKLAFGMSATEYRNARK